MSAATHPFLFREGLDVNDVAQQQDALSGRVVGPNGNPVGGADVWAVDSISREATGLTTTSDESGDRGRFELSLENGEHTQLFYAKKDDWFGGAKKVSPAAGSAGSIRLDQQLLFGPEATKPRVDTAFNQDEFETVTVWRRLARNQEDGPSHPVQFIYMEVAGYSAVFDLPALPDDLGPRSGMFTLTFPHGTIDVDYGSHASGLSTDDYEFELLDDDGRSAGVMGTAERNWTQELFGDHRRLSDLMGLPVHSTAKVLRPAETGTNPLLTWLFQTSPATAAEEPERPIEELVDIIGSSLLTVEPNMHAAITIVELFDFLLGDSLDLTVLAGEIDIEPRDPNSYDTVLLTWQNESDVIQFTRTVVGVVPFRFTQNDDETVEFVAQTEWHTGDLFITGFSDSHGHFGTTFEIGPRVDDVGVPADTGSGGEDGELSGRLLQPDGSPASGHTLVIYGGDSVVAMTTTDEDGRFSYDRPDVSHEIQYYQVDDANPGNERFDPESTIAPRDGTPDMFAVASVDPSASGDLGTIQLPEASPLQVRVVDQNENPVEGAGVDVAHRHDGADAALAGHTNEDGVYDPWPATDETGIELDGQVRVRVVPPEDAGFVDSPTERELSVTEPTEITVTLERTGEQPSGDVTGRILKPDGSPAAEHTLVIYEVDPSNLVEMVTTDEEGYFSYSSPGARHDIQYYQLTDANTDNKRFDPRGPVGPRDGSPDFFALTQLQGAGDLGTFELPEAYPLDIRVVDGDDNPIQNARVTVEHYNDEADAGLGPYLTTADGYFVWGGSDTGIEIRGDVNLVVRPPEGSDNYEISKTEREVQVTEPATVDVTLDQIDP